MTPDKLRDLGYRPSILTESGHFTKHMWDDRGLRYIVRVEHISGIDLDLKKHSTLTISATLWDTDGVRSVVSYRSEDIHKIEKCICRMWHMLGAVHVSKLSNN